MLCRLRGLALSLFCLLDATALGQTTQPATTKAVLPWWDSVALLLAVFVVAYLLNKFNPTRRGALRRVVFLFAVHLLAFGVGIGLRELGLETWSNRLQVASSLFGAFVVVHALAILVFDVLLVRSGIEMTTIAKELSVAGGYIFSFIAVLANIGIDATSLLTASTVVTAVVGLSLQKTLGNVLGGVALQLDNSISVGDWIQLGDGPQGKVTQIRWRHTVIETRNWDTLVIPNATLLDSSITILGKRGGQNAPHRMWIYFEVDYRFAPGEVCRLVQESLRSSPIPNVVADPPPSCVCMDFAKLDHPSLAYYAVRYHLHDLAPDDPTSSAVRDRIYAILKRANIPLAIPAKAIYVTPKDHHYYEDRRERDMQRRRAALDTVDLFDSLSPEERQRLAEQLVSAPFATGESMTRQGTAAHWLYIMAKGSAEVRIERDGTEEVVAQLQGPTFFGEMALLTGEPRTATVIAKTDVECYRLDKDAFKQIVQERQNLAKEISEILATRKVELEAVRDQLDAETVAKKKQEKAGQLLKSIQDFFGLS